MMALVGRLGLATAGAGTAIHSSKSKRAWAPNAPLFAPWAAWRGPSWLRAVAPSLAPRQCLSHRGRPRVLAALTGSHTSAQVNGGSMEAWSEGAPSWQVPKGARKPEAHKQRPTGAAVACNNILAHPTAWPKSRQLARHAGARAQLVGGAHADQLHLILDQI